MFNVKLLYNNNNVKYIKLFLYFVKLFDTLRLYFILFFKFKCDARPVPMQFYWYAYMTYMYRIRLCRVVQSSETFQSSCSNISGWNEALLIEMMSFKGYIWEICLVKTHKH